MEPDERKGWALGEDEEGFVQLVRNHLQTTHVERGICLIKTEEAIGKESKGYFEKEAKGITTNYLIKSKMRFRSTFDHLHYSSRDRLFQ